MTSLLLIIIYLAFISLGLPDALLGSAWPSMYRELGASVSWAGIISMIISAGTIISSFASDWLTRKAGTGKITAVSVGLTCLALFGFSFSSSFPVLCLWAVPYGLGAGSVDAAINNFVALHYPARHMSWLHCMWGIGASIGPVIMGWTLTGNLGWNGGYLIIAVFQAILTAFLFLSLPLWKKAPVLGLKAAYADTPTEKRPSVALPALFARKGIKEVFLCFFAYNALEATAGMWAASYCTLGRGIDSYQAARWASLFYLGITAGRFICGFITIKVNDQNMIRLGQVFIGIGLLFLLLPGGNRLLLPGLIFIGLGCAPIYPSIIHETPANFGADLSQAIIGIQMAFAYIGCCLMPPFFGLLAEYISIRLYPVFMMFLLILMIFMAELLHTRLKRPSAGA